MIEKIINGGNYQPTLTDKIVLDSTPTVNSLNGVTSDAVARAVAGASGEVPQVTENDNGKVLKAIYDAGGPAVEWGEAPSSTVSTSGVISGDGSAADPVVLNVGAGLSSVTSGGTTTFTVTDIVGGYFRLTRDQALAILQSQSPVTVNFTGNGSWKCNSAGSEYIFGLNCSGNRTVFFNPLRQWNDATYPQPWEGDISAVNYVLDPSNVDTDHGISAQAMVAALEADPTIEYVYLNYYMPQYGSWTTCPDSLSGYSAVVTVPSASGATTSLVVTNPVPAYAAGDAGKVLKVSAGGTGVEWGTTGGSGGGITAQAVSLSNGGSWYVETTTGRNLQMPSDSTAFAALTAGKLSSMHISFRSSVTVTSTQNEISILRVFLRKDFEDDSHSNKTEYVPCTFIEETSSYGSFLNIYATIDNLATMTQDGWYITGMNIDFTTNISFSGSTLTEGTNLVTSFIVYT